MRLRLLLSLFLFSPVLFSQSPYLLGDIRSIGLHDLQWQGPVFQANGKAWFGAIGPDYGDDGLYQFDGQVATMVEPDLTFIAQAVEAASGFFVFNRYSTTEQELWKTDGTPAGARRVDLLTQVTASDNIIPAASLGNMLLYSGVRARAANSGAATARPKAPAC